MRLLVSLAFLMFVLTTCDSSRVYEDIHDFKERTWNVTDTPRFEFYIRDPGKKYNLYYNIRNSLEYPYARLFIRYSLQDSTGAELQMKLISEYLFDQKTGQPQGASGLGDIYDHRFPIVNGFEFKHAGKYNLEMEQFMRLDTLPGVISVGVRVETARENK